MTSRAALLSVLALSAFGFAACGGDDPGPASSEEQDLLSGPKLQYEDYKVLFTNPECATYEFGDDQEVYAENGERLTQKPQNVFCTYDDGLASGARESSPQYQLLEWINDPETTEVFFTYLSFSSSAVQKALCTAIEERNVKVTFVLDSGTNTTKADRLMECQPGNGDPEYAPRFEKRGHTPGIGYAHNKLFMVNPGSERMKIAFSSGNMSSGVVLHHENWHFITLRSDNYFAQSHICLMNAELDHWESKSEYRSYLDDCQEAIPYKEESDIRGFFVPADRYGARDRLVTAVRTAEKIDIAAHRFTYSTLMRELRYRLDSDGTPVRLVGDDDMYWAGKGDQVGDNMAFEFYNAKSIEDRDGEVRWMETNHEMHLLHHNKFLIFDMPEGEPDAVWCGAGNLTGTGFSKNWENFYYVTIPEVVDAYKAQYEHMWEDLATPSDRMPTENVMPATD